MPSLSKDLRNQLARVTLSAREASEKACRAALENLAVHEKDYRGHMTLEQRQLRNRLRARGRALGDELDHRSGRQEITHLAEDAAYEHWHRLLFTRFLAENGLLHTGETQGNVPVPVTLEDCEELAPDLDARDGFELACRFAEKILPGVFRTADPVFELNLALNDQVELRKLLDSLPDDVFTTDDSLGWTYQFWQATRKDEVNKSGKKIGADEISPVTQLFTEDYMVEFLLHNTLGAWWAGKLGPIEAGTEEEARAKAALAEKDGIGITWNYLRFIQDEQSKAWKPAAGIFDGWPKEAKDIKFLDPCMGSGHFPVFALPILARLRMEEEGLNASEAIHAVLRDNIHGLELDPRCCQIGAFNLALTAWKLGGYQALPPLNVACCGLAPRGTKDDWIDLAGEEEKLRNGMERLYDLFKQAPVLGSLINPHSGESDLLVAAFHELQPLLEKALALEAHDDTAHEMAVTARGLAKAADMLAGQFTLVATNVPYLSNRKQSDCLKEFCTRKFASAKNSLAVTFLLRLIDACKPDNSVALVMAQNWLFAPSYPEVRADLLKKLQWRVLAKLGAGAFETITGEVVNVALGVWNKTRMATGDKMCTLDAMDKGSTVAKAEYLREGKVDVQLQARQLENLNNRIVIGETSDQNMLDQLAIAPQGAKTGDDDRWRLCMWEPPALKNDWVPYLSTVKEHSYYGGRHLVLDWRTKGVGMVRPRVNNQAIGKMGVAVSQTGKLYCMLYQGERFNSNVAPIVPDNETDVVALWTYCASADYHRDVRILDQSLKVTNVPLIQVPFDLTHWQKVAAEKYPDGLPKPFSSDPTQWLFNGHPAGADQPLHVAVARLLGYQWPRQTGSSFSDCPALGPDGLEKLADDDGIVCLPPLNREQPAANRLRELLGAALTKFDERALIASAGPKGSKSSTLEDWLRDEFFEQHCALFHKRPFIWHIWDGHKDGFAALVNYHQLDHANVQKLTYSYLGDWINQQEADAKAEKPGADARLGAAQSLQAELAKILEGEAPYDILVRWKPLSKQAIGWNPDLNDGVRMNIRPFIVAKDVGKKGAGLFRAKPNIKWNRDRGKEPQRDKTEYPWFWHDCEPGTDPIGGKQYPTTDNRWNDVHLTLNNKRAARE